jgi:hypothetical protein
MKYGSDRRSTSGRPGYEDIGSMWNTKPFSSTEPTIHRVLPISVWNGEYQFPLGAMKDLEITASGPLHDVWNNAGAMSEANFKKHRTDYTNGIDARDAGNIPGAVPQVAIAHPVRGRVGGSCTTPICSITHVQRQPRCTRRCMLGLAQVRYDGTVRYWTGC